MTTEQALILAEKLEDMRDIDFDDVFVKAAAELRRLNDHHRQKVIQECAKRLEAVGAITVRRT